MLMRNTVTLAAGLAVLAVVGATAGMAQGLPPAQGGRYAMHPVEGGALRLDTQSGTMSMCRQKAGQWACEALPDERQSLEKEIDRLATENKDLKGSVKRLEDLAGLPDSQAKPKVQLPTEQDLDKAMTYIQRMVRKFKEKLKEFEDLDPNQSQRL